MNYVEEYVNKVISYVSADEYTLKRLSEDLVSHIYEASADGDIEKTIARMGSPKDMAQELMDSIYQEKGEVVRELVNAKAQIQEQNRYSHYEFKSKARIFGIPLVHVNFSRNRFFSKGVAKGIIAIGNISVGVLSIGGLAFGGLCIGGVGAGLISLGGIAIGLLLAIGGAAIGAFALGGLAVGIFAFGGCAIASHIAIGGYASATVAIGGTAKGLHTISTGGTSLNTGMVAASEARSLILQAYPNIWGYLVNIVTSIFA